MAHDEIVEWLRVLIAKLTPQERAALLDESNEDDMRYPTFLEPIKGAVTT